MTTELTDSPAEAAAFLRRGQVVAFPTETVYGLGANALEESAVAGIFEAKGRPSDNPLIIHLAMKQQIATVSEGVSAPAQLLIERFFPGPLTLVLKKRAIIPDIVTAGLPSVGIRMPRHPLARAFLEECGVPVAAPSANVSGRPSPTSWKAVLRELDGRISCILKGGRSAVGLESTVVDCTSDAPVVLRTGAITFEELREVIPTIRLNPADSKVAPASPGLRHRHYSPSARVILLDGPRQIPLSVAQTAAYIGLESPPEEVLLHSVRICRSVEQYAHELYDFFHHCDEAGIEVIYVQRVPEVGLGRALLDRLNRASEKFS